MSDVTVILDRVRQGDPNAAKDLLPLIYPELRHVAAARMALQPPGHTLQATALVHEAWLRLMGNNGEAQFQDRRHFFSAAAEAMRHILIDRARRKQALRHGGDQQHVNADDIEIAAPVANEEMLALNEALDRLAAVDSAKAELVKLRFFVGLTISETATVLGISEPTVKRRWALARAWLFNEIRPHPE